MCISNLLTDRTVIQYYISICVCSVTSVVFILCRVGQCSDKRLGLGLEIKSLALVLAKKSWSWKKLEVLVLVLKTRKPSYRWQTRATRKPAEIASIRRAYNVVVYNTGLASCVLLLRPKSTKSREIHWKFQLMEFKVIQGHRSWCQSKAHMWLAISH